MKILEKMGAYDVFFLDNIKNEAADDSCISALSR